MQTKKPWKRFTFYVIGVLFLLGLFVRIFFPIHYVAGDSMEPTIDKGSYVMVSRIHYLLSNVRRNDIVMFGTPLINKLTKETVYDPWIHRIIGVAGDQVVIDENKTITVNGEKTLFPNSSASELDIIKPDTILRFDLNDGEVFQKGDNENSILGVKQVDDIIGKVIYVF